MRQAVVSAYSGRHNGRRASGRKPFFVFGNFNVQALLSMSYQMAFSANCICRIGTCVLVSMPKF